MKIKLNLISIFLITFFIIVDHSLAQLKGRMKLEKLELFERAPTENPLVRIKSTIPDLNFSWSGGQPDVNIVDGDWIITLKPGLQTLTIYSTNFESLDTTLTLMKHEARTYRIIPIIPQFYLKIETEPHNALVLLTDSLTNLKIQRNAPFEYHPSQGTYYVIISHPDYPANKIDTTITIRDDPRLMLKFNLTKINKINKRIKGKSPLMAFKGFKDEELFELNDHIFNKINAYILQHFRSNNNVSIITDTLSDIIFASRDSGKGLTDIKERYNIDYLLDHTVSVFNQKPNPDSNIINIEINFSYFKNKTVQIIPCTKRNLFNDNLFFKIDTCLAKIDLLIMPDNNLLKKVWTFIKSDKGNKITGFIIWSFSLILAENSVKRREPLPRAPRFPKLYKKN